MSNYVVTGVPAILVPVLWGQAKQFIADAVEHSNDETSIDIIYENLIQKDAVLVIIYKGHDLYGAAIAREREYESGKKAICITQLGGLNMQEWISDAHDVACKIGRALGCTEIYCIGRSGWEKTLKGIGYAKAYTVLSTSIGD